MLKNLTLLLNILTIICKALNPKHGGSLNPDHELAKKASSVSLLKHSDYGLVQYSTNLKLLGKILEGVLAITILGIKVFKLKFKKSLHLIVTKKQKKKRTKIGMNF